MADLKLANDWAPRGGAAVVGRESKSAESTDDPILRDRGIVYDRVRPETLGPKPGTTNA